MAHCSSHPRLWGPAPPYATSLSRMAGKDILSLPSSGRSPKACRCSGAPYGVLKTPPRTGLRWFAQTPVGASRAPSQAGSRRETPDRARGALYSARRVRRAPGRSEARRGPRAVCAAKRPGRISFGDFSLSVQRKVTCRGSATHKYASPKATQIKHPPRIAPPIRRYSPARPAARYKSRP